MVSSNKVAPLEVDFPFEILSYLIPVIPYREYPHAIIDEEKGVKLSVKQYIPHRTTDSSNEEAPLTIIAAGGLGFPKELYEPLFEELLHRARSCGVTIRSIWIADMFNLGESGVVNQDNLGCDAAWIDHSRDLWSMINHFSELMPKPIIGLGHSMGCNQLLCLASWHPTLFHSFAFIEPGIDLHYGRGIEIPWLLRVLKQNETWKTRQEAEEGVVNVQGAQFWNEKAIIRLKRYGVFWKRTPQEDCWIPTSPKNQTAVLVSRHNPGNIGFGPSGLDEVTLSQREAVPDSDPSISTVGPFYRRELKLGWDMLPSMRPWVLYINGGNSPFFGHPDTQKERARLTGIGPGGNGGMRLGAVKQIVIENGEHTIPFDKNLTKVAHHVADWLATESRRWVDGPMKRRQVWQNQSIEEKQSVGKDYISALVDMKKGNRATKL
ncbi:hypothetical protein N7495_008810 [Penicillium taxi]|uniref:uncharacterized protein n=1 Tax=Penicillium taxi TaxID=168475 RepID=UPI002544F790|nr:uncharacterized protein N7495_008810 [Penicillium taxi]KAJ5888769.1 hypothetical protein N7495_008810 [Penicillium taxi]